MLRAYADAVRFYNDRFSIELRETEVDLRRVPAGPGWSLRSNPALDY
jgi:hypothetical protein